MAAQELPEHVISGLMDSSGECPSKTASARQAIATKWGRFRVMTQSEDVSQRDTDQLLYQVMTDIIDVLQGQDIEARRVEKRPKKICQSKTEQYHT